MKTPNLSTLQVFQSLFPQIQKSVPSVLPKRVYQVPLRFAIKFAKKKPAKHKKTSRDKISKQISVDLSKKNHLDAKKRRSAIRKRVATHKSNYPSRQKPFVMKWSSLFSSLLLCTTTTTKVRILWQLKSRSFQYQALKIAEFNFVWCGTGILLSDVAQQLLRKNADIPDN